MAITVYFVDGTWQIIPAATTARVLLVWADDLWTALLVCWDAAGRVVAQFPAGRVIAWVTGRPRDKSPS